MSKKYYEFNDREELSAHLKYWSNACGELHHYGEYDLEDESELPDELQRAYRELWKEGNGCHEYLAEYDGKYYIALVSEFDKTFADDENLSMDKLYEIGKENALELYGKDLFKNTVLVVGKETGIGNCHEIIFLVPAMESENVYDDIENNIYMNIWNVREGYEVEANLEEKYACDKEKSNDMNMILWNELKKHRGHKVSIVSYGDWDNPEDVCLECEDCGEVVLDAEIYTLCAREDV